MLNQSQFAAFLIKVAVAASIASILMRFASMQRLLLKDERTVGDRLQLAFTFSLVFGGGAAIRVLSKQYQAVDLALEGSVIAGMLGGYVSGLITGLLVSIPDMFFGPGKYMSMPLFAATGILGAMMHDLAPQKEDIWYFSPFIDLNLYRLLRQMLFLKRSTIQRRIVQRAAFNTTCNALVVLAELLRWGVHSIFKQHNTFFLLESDPHLTPAKFVVAAATTLFAVSLPIRVWSSFRAERQLEIQRASLVEARLQALTNQINPHFLFNTLNSIASLIRIDPERARGMIYRLSKILRRLLRKTENFSPLREEVSFIDDYLAIEMTRFGDKLRFHKDLANGVEDFLVPSMILQPLIENSVKHGISSKLEGGAIWLRAWLERGRLHLIVEDDGVGMSQEQLETVYERGIGVSNVRERLRVLFGSSCSMTVDSSIGAGARTVIVLPEVENYPDSTESAVKTSA